MNFFVDESIFSHYPELQLAVIVAHGLNNSGTHSGIQQIVAQEVERSRYIFSTLQPSAHPNIHSWRKAYQVFGAASRYHSSIESLVTRVAKGKDLPIINPLVDLYNAVSLKYVVPIGGEDLQHITGDLQLTIAKGNESFFPLGSEQEETPDVGEVLYRDDLGVICRRFNWREADRTKLTAHTKHAIFVIEGLPPVNDIEVKEAASVLGDYIQKYCGGTTEYFLVNRQRPIIQIIS